VTSTQQSSSERAAGQLIKHPTRKPSRKVGYGAAAGAVSTIVVWIITITTGVEMPAEVCQRRSNRDPSVPGEC
jgi:hypothetical protein